MIGLGTGLWPAARQGLGGDIAAPAPLLLIVAGQSNAGKQGTTGQTPPGKYADLGSLRIWDGGSAFVDYQVGSNPGDYPNAWGTEAEFVFQMRQAGDDRPVYLVKRALGSTSVGAVGGTDWSPASTGELFDQLAARAAAARTAIASAEAALPVEITFWNQGENDIQNNGQAAAFAANMAAFLDSYRVEISAGLFILERTRPFPGWYSNSFAIRKAQLDTVLADGNALAIDGDFEPGDFATLHPPPSWCEGIGLRAHAAWTGAYTGSFGAISDAVPAAFGFTDLTGQMVSSAVTSEAVTPTGYERDAAIGVSGGEYRILNPDDAEALGWGSAPGRISKWQKVQVRLTSSAEGETARSLTLTIGGIATVWSVTTGSGLVVIAYPTGSLTASRGTVTTSGGMTIHSFTASGSLVVTALG